MPTATTKLPDLGADEMQAYALLAMLQKGELENYRTTAYYRTRALDFEARCEWGRAADFWQLAIDHYPRAISRYEARFPPRLNLYAQNT